MAQSLIDKYTEAVAKATINEDAGQRGAVIVLQNLTQRVMLKSPIRLLFAQFFGIKDSSSFHKQGVYLWGGVGRGKTMLMDMFYDSVPISRKWRVHFHDFMQHVHKEMHIHRKAGADDPLKLVIEAMVKDYDLLCFDELQVDDVADASILSRLFEGLVSRKLYIVFTSNRPPEDLYLHGLQRDRFLPFIVLLHKCLTVHEILSETDYRHSKVVALAERYLYPANSHHQEKLLSMFTAMCGNHDAKPEDILHQGRVIHVPRAYADVAWFSFNDICGKPYAAGDYLALAKHYKLFFISGIPRLTKESRNEAKRFITLIDVLYEAHAGLCCTAEVAAKDIYTRGDGSFEFERTASRLHEMMSDDY